MFSIHSGNLAQKSLIFPFSSHLFGNRSLQTTSRFSSTTLCDQRLSTYLCYQQARNGEKAHMLFQWTVANQLKQHGITSKGSEHKDWKMLQNALKRNSIELPHFQENQPESMLAEIANNMPRPLIQNFKIVKEYTPEAYIKSGTDLYWSFYPPAIPMTRRIEHQSFDPHRIQYILDQFPEAPLKHLSVSEKDQESLNYATYSVDEDALAAHLLALRFASEQTVVHEVGCWNGSNLINFLYLSHFHNKEILGCIGTDINLPALNFADFTSQMLRIRPSIKFYRSHALTTLEPHKLGLSGNKILRLALKVIPVLDLTSAKKFLQISFLGNKNVVLILSYATKKGQTYKNNLKKSSKEGRYEYRKEEFDGGVTFYAPFPSPELSDRMEIVVNTYYDTKGFQSLVSDLGLRISERITVGNLSDNDRDIVVIERR